MARKKRTGMGRNGRDSRAKYLGVKKNHQAFVEAGNIIVRQRGYRIHAGNYVGVGKDFTLYALVAGTVCFTSRGRKGIRVVEVLPSA